MGLSQRITQTSNQGRQSLNKPSTPLCFSIAKASPAFQAPSRQRFIVRSSGQQQRHFSKLISRAKKKLTRERSRTRRPHWRTPKEKSQVAKLASRQLRAEVDAEKQPLKLKNRKNLEKTEALNKTIETHNLEQQEELKWANSSTPTTLATLQKS